MKTMIKALMLVLLLASCKSSDSNDAVSEMDKIVFEDVGLTKCWEQIKEGGYYNAPSEVTQFACYEVESLDELYQLPNIKHLVIKDSYIEHLDLSTVSEVETVYFSGVFSKGGLLLSDNKELRDITIGLSGLKYVSAENSTSLQSVLVLLSDIKVAIFHGNALLNSINIESSNLEHISVFESETLTSLVVLNNNLNEIALIELNGVSLLNVKNNNIENIDTSKLPALERFDASGNNLQEINLDDNPMLKLVDLTNNNLSKETRVYLDSINWIDELIF